MKNKKYLAFVLLLTIMMLGSLSFARADDDDEDDDDDRDDRRSEIIVPAPVPEPVPTPSPAPEVKTEKPKVIQPQQVVAPQLITITETVLQDVILQDSDRDGIEDSKDPFPEIAQIYIVVDDNNNGIVDTFERF